ncbi:xyloglucan endotransglycosylase/hydrolase protein 8-like [Phragmites australis]|uniref:xyloglucan endotransglycosylase/hydrolase protein 8-like n=1 Tax=Phragmites australis TaxID=29695 RepID=UPI002D768A31|nr:xyloglucan endotransglycosylase/hydrolase protein 8-like [Phragmites australis]
MARQSLALLASLAVAVLSLLRAASAESWLYEQFATDGDVRVDYDASGEQVASLILDQHSGAGFISKQKYLFGEFSVQMKLIPGNSAGTVTSFYLTSGEGDEHDEIDMEFMGNSSGAPVVLNTNVWANGDGKKEHQFYLWFDPTADFHTYTVIWNDKNIIFQVDNVTVRAFKRYDDLPYPDAKPMEVHATVWDGSYWATRKGEVKIDWSGAPFAVLYRRYSADACVSRDGRSSCPAGSNKWMNRQLDDTDRVTVAWAGRNCLQYNYCDDGWRFPQGFPGECSRN